MAAAPHWVGLYPLHPHPPSLAAPGDDSKDTTNIETNTSQPATPEFLSRRSSRAAAMASGPRQRARLLAIPIIFIQIGLVIREPVQ